MKPFKFQEFTINQSAEVFRVGTDGVLLGVLANAGFAQNILEVGTGTGLISLMLAQRNPVAPITALDITEEAANLAADNFNTSPFSERLKAVQKDFKIFESEEKFDLIVSNPPYFEENSSGKDIIARQKVELDFAELIKKASEFITERGIFSVIIPYADGAEFIAESIQQGFHLIRKIIISGIEGSKPRRLILEFSKTPKPFAEKSFTIEKSPRKYSDEYLEVTRDFHIFGK